MSPLIMNRGSTLREEEFQHRKKNSGIRLWTNCCLGINTYNSQETAKTMCGILMKHTKVNNKLKICKFLHTNKAEQQHGNVTSKYSPEQAVYQTALIMDMREHAPSSAPTNSPWMTVLKTRGSSANKYAVTRSFVQITGHNTEYFYLIEHQTYF